MKTILVVDDEPDLDTLIRQKFRRQIRGGEFHFLTAHNGVEALTVLERSPDVDVALCDINMPQMDGLTFLDHLRERYPLIKPVMISAYGDMENIRGAMNRGAFDFLTKPLELHDLEVTLGRALAQAQRMRETLRAIRENSILKMFVNDGVFRYLSLNVSEERLRTPEAIDASVAFFDVCGFTRLAESSPPELIVDLLDDYFDRVVGAVVGHHGFIDKFIGDAVMAVFREPGHAAHALQASVAARDAIISGGDRLRERLGHIPAIAVGVHSGPMLACSIGARTLGRFDFTVIGDVVNTAARLEGEAGPWQILATDQTCDLAGEPYQAVDRGLIQVKGKEQELRVLEVAPLASPPT